MFASVAVKFSFAVLKVYITPAMFFSAIDCVEVMYPPPVAVTEPVTAVDTEAIGMTRSAVAALLAIPASGKSR
jgi:hypothetical protein